MKSQSKSQFATMVRGNQQTRFATVLPAFLMAALGLIFPVAANAATFTVDRTDDASVSACSATANDCTLRGAVTKANAIAGADTITFDTTLFSNTQVISLATALGDLSSDVTITGPGAGLLTVKSAAKGFFTIFFVKAGVSATLSGLTVNNGDDGIHNEGTLTATNCTISGNREGIYNADEATPTEATLTATNCTISGNTYSGIDNTYGATLTATNCTINGNGSNGISNNLHATLIATNCTISGNSYGIANAAATITANNCTISGNSSTGIYTNGAGEYCTMAANNCTISGSGYYGISNVTGSTLTVVNCTMSGNANAGIYNFSKATVTAKNCTISGNTDKGIENRGTLTATNCTLSGNIGIGLHNNNLYSDNPILTVTSCTVSGHTSIGIRNTATITIKNSLVAGNATNLSGAFTNGGFNITSGTAAQAGLEVDGSGSPVLADNGGPTKTIKLLPGSKAMDKGNAFGETTDQRGQVRPYDNPANANATGGDGSDIGAFEDQTPALAVNNPRSLNEGSAGSPGSVTFDITLNAASTQSVTVNYQTTNGINNPALAGSDYVAKSGKLTFAPGETLKRVTINFTGDGVPELHETFFFDLKTSTNATIADNRGVGTIRNDDGPTIAISDATTDEGNSGSTSQTFVVSLSAASTDTITVYWETAPSTAGADDYVAASGTLTFAPGETSKIITVLVNGDMTVEPDETYTITLNKPTYAVLSDLQALGTIRNDDAAAPLLFGNDEPSE